MLIQLVVLNGAEGFKLKKNINVELQDSAEIHECADEDAIQDGTGFKQTIVNRREVEEELKEYNLDFNLFEEALSENAFGDNLHMLNECGAVVYIPSWKVKNAVDLTVFPKSFSNDQIIENSLRIIGNLYMFMYVTPNASLNLTRIKGCLDLIESTFTREFFETNIYKAIRRNYYSTSEKAYQKLGNVLTDFERKAMFILMLVLNDLKKNNPFINIKTDEDVEALAYETIVAFKENKDRFVGVV